eukprot:4484433-Pleurochrysis_carterae.AAC.1
MMLRSAVAPSARAVRSIASSAAGLESEEPSVLAVSDKRPLADGCEDSVGQLGSWYWVCVCD